MTKVKLKHLTLENRISIEIFDINSTKSPYREKKQINIKYYSSGKIKRKQKKYIEH